MHRTIDRLDPAIVEEACQAASIEAEFLVAILAAVEDEPSKRARFAAIRALLDQ